MQASQKSTRTLRLFDRSSAGGCQVGRRGIETTRVQSSLIVVVEGIQAGLAGCDAFVRRGRCRGQGFLERWSPLHLFEERVASCGLQMRLEVRMSGRSLKNPSLAGEVLLLLIRHDCSHTQRGLLWVCATLPVLSFFTWCGRRSDTTNEKDDV